MLSSVMPFLSQLFSSEFMPHGHCYFWRPLVLWLNVGSDALIALSYYSIPIALLVVLRKRSDVHFKKIVALFAAFIFLCGTTHLFDIWTVWHGTYYIEGILKAVTALVSLSTAIVLWILIPKILLIPSTAQLQQEVEARKAAEEELQRLNEVLERKAHDLKREGDVKTRVLIDVSRELRTPISLIVGPLESLLDSADLNELSERHHKDLELVLSSAHHMRFHIESLLEFAAIGNGNFACNFERVDVIQITRAFVHLFESQAEKKNIKLRCMEHQRPCFLYLDINLWEKVMFSLIGNAIEFTDEGSIEVQFIHSDTMLAISFSDSGLGVPQEQIDSIFDRGTFEKTNSSSRAGFGIGLALVKEIILLHGGSIQAWNNRDTGVTIRIDMPYRENELLVQTVKEELHLLSNFQQESVQSHDDKERQTEQVETISTSLNQDVVQKDLVFLVDDSPEILFFVTRVLQKNYRVETAANGLEALERLSDISPDLILLDLMMPHMNGMELVETMREKNLCSNVPIVLISANADFDSQQEALQRTGASDLIPKPFHYKELLSVVERRLKESRRVLALESTLLNRMAAIVNSSTEAMFSIDKQGQIDSWNDGAADLFGIARTDAIGLSAKTLMAREIDGFAELLERAQCEERSTNIELKVNTEDGERFLLGSVSPIHEDNGTMVGAGVVCSDVTSQREVNRHLRLLIAELNHRVKNTLAVVLSIAHKTRDMATTFDEFTSAFEGRLQTLAMAHSLLTANNWTHTELSELVAKVIAPYRDQANAHIQCVGVSVSCSAKVAVTLCLLLHELCTNAVKYGGLSECGGSIDVHWTLHSDNGVPMLELSWVEQANRDIVWDSKEGFGSILVRQGVEYELDGSVEEERHKHGVSYTFTFPLKEEVGTSHDMPVTIE